MGRRYPWTFSKQYIQVIYRPMKRHSTSVIVREMQIKTTMRYHLVTVRRAIIKRPRKIKTNKKLNQVSIGKDVEKKETIRHCRWEYELLQPLRKTVWSWLKISKIELPCCCCCSRISRVRLCATP